MKKIILSLLSVLLLTACTSETVSDAKQEKNHYLCSEYEIFHMLSLFNVVYNIYSIVNRVADFIETFGLALR